MLEYGYIGLVTKCRFAISLNAVAFYYQLITKWRMFEINI